MICPLVLGIPVFLNEILLKSFEIGDLRKANWIDSVTVGTDTFYFSNKYKILNLGESVSEYLMVLRLIRTST